LNEILWKKKNNNIELINEWIRRALTFKKNKTYTNKYVFLIVTCDNMKYSSICKYINYYLKKINY